MTATAEAPARRRSPAAAAKSAAGTVRADARSWWLVAARPSSLAAWARTIRPTEVPDDSPLLRLLWTVDNAVFGTLLRAAATVLYLAAGALAWLAGHPARRWSAITAAGAITVWIITNHI